MAEEEAGRISPNMAVATCSKTPDGKDQQRIPTVKIDLAWAKSFAESEGIPLGKQIQDPRMAFLKKPRLNIFVSSNMDCFDQDPSKPIPIPTATPLECLTERRRLAEYHEILRTAYVRDGPYNFLEPTVTPTVLNVVASASIGNKLDLKKIMMTCPNVEYNPKRFAPCVMRIRNPKSTCLIFESGRLIVSGCKSQNECYQAVRRYVRVLQKLVEPGIKRILSYEIQNMSASCTLPFGLLLSRLATTCDPSKNFISYEPELFPGLVLRLVDPKARVVLFSGGAMLFTGLKSEQELHRSMKLVYPVCRACRR